MTVTSKWRPLNGVPNTRARNGYADRNARKMRGGGGCVDKRGNRLTFCWSGNTMVISLMTASGSVTHYACEVHATRHDDGDV